MEGTCPGRLLGHRAKEPVQGLLRPPELFLVRDDLRELRGERKAVRDKSLPFTRHLRGRDSVEARVDLHEVEDLPIRLQELFWGRVAGIERPAPLRVGVPDAPDLPFHGPAMAGPWNGAFRDG